MFVRKWEIFHEFSLMEIKLVYLLYLLCWVWEMFVISISMKTQPICTLVCYHDWKWSNETWWGVEWSLVYTQIWWTFTVFGLSLMELHLHQRGTLIFWLLKSICVIVHSTCCVLFCAFKGIGTPDLGTRQFCCGDTAVMAWLNWCMYNPSAHIRFCNQFLGFL